MSQILKELLTSWWGLVLVGCVVVGLLIADQLGFPPLVAGLVGLVSFRGISELAVRAGWSKPPGYHWPLAAVVVGVLERPVIHEPLADRVPHGCVHVGALGGDPGQDVGVVSGFVRGVDVQTADHVVAVVH